MGEDVSKSAGCVHIAAATFEVCSFLLILCFGEGVTLSYVDASGYLETLGPEGPGSLPEEFGHCPETAPVERPTRHCWGLLPWGYFARAPHPREITSGRRMSARNVSPEDKVQDTFHRSALRANKYRFK